MKHAYLILLIFSLALVACGDTDSTDAATSTTGTIAEDPSSPGATGRKITELVIANDYNGLANMIITHDEMEEAISGSNAPKAGKEFAISRIDDEIKEMQVDTKTGLDQIRSSGTSAGIVWENCKFKEARPTIDESRGFEMLTLKCVMDCNGQEYIFTVTDIVGTDNGWKLGGKMMYGDVQTK